MPCPSDAELSASTGTEGTRDIVLYSTISLVRVRSLGVPVDGGIENRALLPMRMYPAIHYTMGGLWVDYDLQSNLPGLFVGGEANFSDHGANRLGASALMQGLADGYFILPVTVSNFLASQKSS